MPDRFRAARAAVALAMLVVAAGCVPGPTPNEINFSDEGMSQGVAVASRTPIRGEVVEVEIGRSVNDDRTIADRTRDFQPKDAVHVSLRVLGRANSGILRVVWFDPEGQPAHQETRIVSPVSGERIAVQASRPQGWPAGDYSVEVFLDDRLMHTQSFRVGGAAAGSGPQQQGADRPEH